MASYIQKIESNDLYIKKIVNLGLIKVEKDNVIFIKRKGMFVPLKTRTLKSGYVVFGKNLRLHRLVYYYFHKNLKSNLQINHINGIRSDNSISNLEMVSCSENISHAYKVLKRKQNTQKIFEQDYRKIKELLKTENPAEIAKKFNVSTRTIYRVLKKINNNLIQKIVSQHEVV